MIERYVRKERQVVLGPQPNFRKGRLTKLMDPDMPAFLNRAWWSEEYANWMSARDLELRREYQAQRRSVIESAQPPKQHEEQVTKRTRQSEFRGKKIIALTTKNSYWRGTENNKQFSLLLSSKTTDAFFRAGGKVSMLKKSLKKKRVRLEPIDRS